MRLLFNFLLSVWVLLTIAGCAAVGSPVSETLNPTNPGIFGIFEGITPCSNLIRPLPQIPEDTNCEQMIWKFTLYQNPSTGAPTTYQMDSAYGLPKQGTTGLKGGGTTVVMEGEWTILKGTNTDPDAVVYRLNPDTPQTSVSFLKISDDILHILNKDNTLLVGNGAWSYTINRTDNCPPLQIVESASVPVPLTPLVFPSMPVNSSVLGVFEGGTPCHDIVFEFAGLTPHSRCMKIKWQLALYQDKNADVPNAYVYRGTSTIREGTWTIVPGTKRDPDAVIYQLHPHDSQQPMSFLKADDNHLFLLDKDLNFLVGNALFSYTLSRTDGAAP